jgi:hypothetical protein
MEIKPLFRASVGLLALPAWLTGCVANSSNPVVSVHSASLTPDSAAIVLNVRNPGGRNLSIEHVSYEVSHGSSGFPVTGGSWDGRVLLAAGADAQIPLSAEFLEPLLEPDSNLLHIAGEISHTDKTGFFGIRSLDLGSTAFVIETEATREQLE